VKIHYQVGTFWLACHTFGPNNVLECNLPENNTGVFTGPLLHFRMGSTITQLYWMLYCWFGFISTQNDITCVKTFWKNLQILLCCCDSLGVRGDIVCFGFMISVLLIGSNCYHYTVLGMEGSFNLLGSWTFFPFCTYYVTHGFEKMFVDHHLQIFVPWVSIMWWSSKCTVKENTECYYSGSLI